MGNGQKPAHPARLMKTSTWLSCPKISKNWYPCYDFLTPQFQNFRKEMKNCVTCNYYLSYQVFIMFVCCFTINNLSTFFCSDQIFKITHFKSKIIFLFSSLLVGFDFVVLFICALYDVCFTDLWLCNNESIISQIIWHNKRTHGLKNTSCCIFRFPRKLSLRLILPA